MPSTKSMHVHTFLPWMQKNQIACFTSCVASVRSIFCEGMHVIISNHDRFDTVQTIIRLNNRIDSSNPFPIDYWQKWNH